MLVFSGNYNELLEYVIFAAVEPAFDPLRADPRFELILRQLRLADDSPFAALLRTLHLRG